MTQGGETPKCRNCDAVLQGTFCHECGQSSLTIRRPTWEIIKEATSHILHLDTRLLGSLKLLFFFPGRLSLNWLQGKRASQVPPFRLYIVASFILFLLIGIATDDMDLNVVEIQVNSEQLQSLNAELDKAREEAKWLTGIFLQSIIETIENPVQYVQRIVSNLPKAAFLMLPLFALLHMGVNFRQKRYYIDYLIFSLNFHAFAFFLISISLLLSLISEKLETPADLLNLLVPVYGVIAFKTFNQQGWLKSILKAGIAFGFYSITLMILVVIYFGATVLI